MTNYKFSFHCVDNGGKHQAFTVSAPNKAAAIEKAMKKARKNAAGGSCWKSGSATEPRRTSGRPGSCKRFLRAAPAV